MTLKAWVTGSRGFVGSSLVKSLPKHGFTVTCVTNSRPVQKKGVYVNYGSRESILSVIDAEGVPDVLFHLGWGSVYEPQSPVHLDQNLANTKTLLDELYENGLHKAILIGSSSEYGSREGCLSETDPPVGQLTNYAQAKLEACRYGLDAASKYNKIFIHVRLFHILGVGDRQDSLINQLYKSYCDSTALGLTACEQFRDYIYLSDAVDGIIRISEIDSSEIINLGSGRKIQLKELIKLFWDKLGAPTELLRFGAHERPSHEPVQPPCYASLDKLRRMTNWQPTLSIEEGILKTISELKGRS
jgi:nucleoside-diphosphate-sugar epimerase